MDGVRVEVLKRQYGNCAHGQLGSRLRDLADIAHKAVTALGHRLDVLVLVLVIAQSFAKHRNGNREVALFDEGIAPQSPYQLRPFDKMAAVSDQDQEGVKGLNRQGHRPSFTKKYVIDRIDPERTKFE